MLISDDFLLHSVAARDLYHGYAKDQPIHDHHCHLSPAQIADNHAFADLAEIWLGEDHYKWRAMRANGVPERLCTGDASPREKFDAWCATVPYTLRNPLYQWSHLELRRCFGIGLTINPANAETIWREANARLATLRVHDILAANRVAVICTTDDPADSLEAHERIRRLGLSTRVYPTFRPDRALDVHQPAAFNAWLERLAGAAHMSIRTFDDLLEALHRRHEEFHACGGRLSDHGLETALAEPCTHGEAAAIFAAARAGRAAAPEAWARHGSYLMREFGRWAARRGWTSQLHLGAMRDNNHRRQAALGSGLGFDSIGDFSQARALGNYFNALEATDEVPRTVLYNLNPADNAVMATLAASFPESGVAGKIQFGSGWWFLDQKEGIEAQLNALSNFGLLRRFVGMVTDSRSFLSYTRHEYFRRVLCNLLGSEMERGELPPDRELIGAMVREICFHNAKDFFRLELARDC